MEFPPRFQLIDVSSPAGSFSTDLPLLLHSVCASCSSCCCYYCCMVCHGLWHIVIWLTQPWCLLLLLNWQFLHVYKPKAKGKNAEKKTETKHSLVLSHVFRFSFLFVLASFITSCTSGSFCFFGCCCCRLRVRSLAARCAHILLIVLFMMLLLLSGSASSPSSPKPNAVMAPIGPHRCHSCHLQVAAVPLSISLSPSPSPTCCICI